MYKLRIVPRQFQCGSFKLSLVSWERSPIKWFTDWILEGGYLEDVCWTPLQLLPLSSVLKGLRAQTVKDTEHMALRDCSEDGTVCTLTDGGTHSGQPPESWHRQAIIPNALTSSSNLVWCDKKTGGETAARWTEKHRRFVLQELEGFVDLRYKT